MVDVSSVNTEIMEIIKKDVAIDMNIVSVKSTSKKNKFLTSNITEEKQSYLKLHFSNDFTLGEVEGNIVKELLRAYYINLDNELEDELKMIFEEAIKKKSSDIHIEAYEKYSYIRYRIDGVLFRVNKISIKKYNKILNRIKVLSNIDISKKLEPQDGKMSFTYNEKNYDIRVSLIPTVSGEKIVMRILYKNENLLNLDNLTFNTEQRKVLKKLLTLNDGIILVNGPTGSGKSTTLYALINSFDKKRKNITTIEDPVEFTIAGITQSNVSPKIGFTFSVGLKHLLRQDPDIILIGEIRDEETAKIAVRAAITGHKVLGTIHTNSARDVYYRLMETVVKNKIYCL